MKIQEYPAFTQAIYKHLRNELNQEREGDHLTDFIFCNMKTILRKRGDAPPTTDEQVIMYWLGHAAQYYLLPIKPEEAKVYVVDDIQMTPDIENKHFAGLQVPLAEMKSTRASMKWFKPDDSKHYIEQMLGYCKALDVTEAVLFVFFLMGDYSPPFPKPRAWHFEFTKKEVDDNWKEILRRREIVHKALDSGNLPNEHLMAFKKECNYCECRPVCPIFHNREMERDAIQK